MATHAHKITALVQGWSALSMLHGRIQAHVECALADGYQLSLREFALLDVLASQNQGEKISLQMKQLANAVALSQSAVTRMVTRLEQRGLLARCFCPDDRRGIHTHVTPEGQTLLEAARPAHEAALHQALDEARRDPNLEPLLRALEVHSS